jgi:HlyD family secretion protein
LGTAAGTIRQLHNAAFTAQNFVTYDAVVDVSSDDLSLQPGMTANLGIVHARREDALLVPNAAL